MFRSRPSDLDLAAWTRSGLDLILCVKLGSGGSGSWGARGGGAARRSSAPWWRSTGVGGLGATGARLGCGLVQKNERDTRGPLGPCTRVRDGRSGVFGGDGGAAAVERRRSPRLFHLNCWIGSQRPRLELKAYQI